MTIYEPDSAMMHVDSHYAAHQRRLVIVTDYLVRIARGTLDFLVPFLMVFLFWYLVYFAVNLVF